MLKISKAFDLLYKNILYTSTKIGEKYKFKVDPNVVNKKTTA